jgi:hypothetical protein
MNTSLHSYFYLAEQPSEISDFPHNLTDKSINVDFDLNQSDLRSSKNNMKSLVKNKQALLKGGALSTS